MNNTANLIKLAVVFLLVILAMQLWNFFRKPEPPPTIGDIKKEMARVDSMNKAVIAEMNKLNDRTAIIDEYLKAKMLELDASMAGIQGELTITRSNSGKLQRGLDSLIRKEKASGAPDRIPTLAELFKRN